MEKRNMTARAVVLGLAVSPLGARVTATTIEDAPAPADSLKGLIAAPHDFQAPPSYVGALLAKDLSGADGCDPSGCSIDLAVSRLILADQSRISSMVRRAYVAVSNYGGVDAPDANLHLSIDGPAEILSAPGCAPAGDGSWDCDVGPLPSHDAWATVAAVQPNAMSGEYMLTATMSSSATDPYPGNDSISHFDVIGGAANNQLRITRIEADACPAMTAEVSYTDAYGETLPGGLSDGSALASLYENDVPLGTPTIDQPLDLPLSLAIVVDNSSAIDAPMWDSVKNALRNTVATWTTNGVPLPAIAVYTASPFRRIGGFGSDAATAQAQLESLEQTPRPTELYTAIRQASADLSSRSGRRAILLVAASTDAHDGSAAEAVRAEVHQADANIYGVALNPAIEPFVRFLGDSSHAFRQVARDANELSVAFARIGGELRAPNRVLWTAPWTGETDKQVRLDVEQATGYPLWALHYYSQSATPCATTCLAQRVIAPRFVSGGTIDVAIDLSSVTSGPVEITETLPRYANVISISDGGTWDWDLHQIRWSFDAGTIPPSVSYVQQSDYYWFENDDDVAEHLEGEVAIGGEAPQAICGDALTRPVGLHPADVYNAARLFDDETDAYARAWRFGSAWVAGPADIPIAYVTRARQLIRMGGVYAVDVDQSPPWVNQSPMPDPGPRSTTRVLPPSYTPGTPFEVRLDVDPGPLATAGAVEDVVPAGWLVSNISDEGAYDPISRKIRWELPQGNSPISLSYTLEADQAAALPVVFIGTLSIDGFDSAIGGANSLATPEQDPLFADGFD